MKTTTRSAVARVLRALPIFGLAVLLTGVATGGSESESIGLHPTFVPQGGSISDEYPPLSGGGDPQEAVLAAEERATDATELGYVPGQIVVMYEETATDAERLEAVEAMGAEEASDVVELKEGDVASLSISDHMTVETAVEKAQNSDAIKVAIPNYVADLLDEPAMAGQTSALVSSTALAGESIDQWHINFVGAPQAWKLLESYGERVEPVRVAVIDTGVSLTHPELSNIVDRNQSIEVIWTDSTSESSWTSRPLQGDGYTNGSSVATEFTSHGTHVSGIIAAEAGNGGVLGVASGGDTSYQNKLVDLVVIDAFSTLNANGRPGATLLDIVFALQHARDTGCKVVNMSLGFVSANAELAQFFDELCTQLTTQNDMLIVCAAGNDGKQSPKNYPAACDSALGVISISDRAAVGNSSRTFLDPAWSGSDVLRSYFSNYGDWCDIAAPGESILSTYIQGGVTDGYSYLNGTSMACPVVSATAALVRAANPALSATEVRSLLCDTAVDLFSSGKDLQTGYGMVNAENAVREALERRRDAVKIQEPVSIRSASATIASASYTGKPQTPTVVVKYGDELLAEGVDYTLSYDTSSMVDVGHYRVTVNGCGAFTGESTVPFSITPAKMASVQISVPNQTYTGSALAPDAVVTWGNITLRKNVDYTLKYQSNVEVGTGRVLITGKGNFSGQRNASFSITAAPAPAPQKPSSPTPSTPSPSTKQPQQSAESQTDASTKAPATASAPATTTKAAAKPSVKKVAKPTLKATKKGFKVSWKKVSGNVSGYQVQYALDKKFKKSVKTKTLSKSKKTLTVKKLKAKKRYYVRVRAYYKQDGQKYYGKWSTVKSVVTKK